MLQASQVYLLLLLVKLKLGLDLNLLLGDFRVDFIHAIIDFCPLNAQSLLQAIIL
jgi:hypothetical protein